MMCLNQFLYMYWYIDMPKSLKKSATKKGSRTKKGTEKKTRRQRGGSYMSRGLTSVARFIPGTQARADRLQGQLEKSASVLNTEIQFLEKRIQENREVIQKINSIGGYGICQRYPSAERMNAQYQQQIVGLKARLGKDKYANTAVRAPIGAPMGVSMGNTAAAAQL
jgi:hypothetical protein